MAALQRTTWDMRMGKDMSQIVPLTEMRLVARGHSFRHLVGGVLDQFSKHPARLKMYDAANCLNCRHMKFAWASLFSVALADLYVRLGSMGVLTDWRLL